MSLMHGEPRSLHSSLVTRLEHEFVIPLRDVVVRFSGMELTEPAARCGGSVII